MSKELEALNKIINFVDGYTYYAESLDKEYEIIKKALKEKEELEKAFIALSKDDEKAKKLLSKEIEKNRAFEIIKKKKVNVIILMGCDSLEEYNKHPLTWNKLTQEEYNLLKEALK